MKRCPTCNKTFSDQNLSFCIEDGTPLIPVTSEEPVAYQSPGPYVPPTVASTRRVWPWVLGIIGVTIVGVVGLSIAAVFAPGLMRRSSGQNDQTANNARPANNSSASATQNAPSNDNSADVAVTTDGSNESANTPAPTDKEKALVQLTDLEHEWTAANLNADKKKLGQILADDYVGPAGKDQLQGKAEYIRNTQRDTSVQKWDFENLTLTLRGDRAMLMGKLRLRIRDQEAVFDFKDKFVWRDGRWQATGSEVTPG